MNKNLLVALVVFLVVVGAVLLLNNNDDTTDTNDTQNVSIDPTPTQTPSQTQPQNPSPVETPTPTATTPQVLEISMTDSGYTPNQLTVKKGETVKFTNNGTKSNWPASAPHPTHTDYPAFDPKKGIAVGESWSFTFDQTGRWPFHDHLNPTRFGAVTVTE